MISAPKIAHAGYREAYIVVDANSGDVLDSYRADSYHYPASLTKLMTLYMTFEALEKGWLTPNQELKVSWTAARRSPSKLGLYANSKIKVHDAILAMITKSANDATTVIAEALGGTEKNFAKMMTKVAKELGMKKTTFKNASGLPNRKQKTSARDMAILAMALIHHFPQYYHLFKERKFTYKDYTHYTHNKLLRKYDGMEGMKTGFISASGFNIVATASKNGRRIIAVVLGKRTQKLRDKKTAKLLDKGFTNLILAKNNVPVPTKKPIEIQEAASEFNLAKTNARKKAMKISRGKYAIQVGAFNSYSVAKKIAGNFHEELNLATSEYDIRILPSGSKKIYYRARLTGLTKDSAFNSCKSLKKRKKPCLVIAPKG
jgi:D-alanyl-D-alanine carboxypeptidase